jgi:hypothetical protein
MPPPRYERTIPTLQRAEASSSSRSPAFRSALLQRCHGAFKSFGGCIGKCGRTAGVFDLHVRARRQQRVDDCLFTTRSRRHQRGPALIVFGVAIDFRRQQQTGRFGISAERCHHQGVHATAGFGMDIGSGSNQRRDAVATSRRRPLASMP